MLIDKPQAADLSDRPVSTLSRILLVEGTPAEQQLALTGLMQNGLREQTTLVDDEAEALDFLYARGPFRGRPSGLPAVVVLGPNLQRPAALSLVMHMRNDSTLQRVPVVMIAVEPDAEMIRSAYEQGVNSLVRTCENAKVHAERYGALALFWAWANEPPPGCLVQPKAQRRAS
jgi:two-component system, response regulator